MSSLKAKIIQPLQMSADGVSQYMQVEMGQSRYQVLPVANVTGLYTQLTAKPGEETAIQHIGRSTSGKDWASLLNAQGTEFGFGTNYINLPGMMQVFYIGKNADFPRGADLDIEPNKPRKNTFSVHMFGKNINIRYVSDVFSADATLADLNEFQGFVGRAFDPSGMNPLFRIWMKLTPYDVMRAAQDPSYNGLKDLFANRWSFREQGEKFKVDDLSGILAQYAGAKPTAPASKPKASIYLHPAGSGEPIELTINPGTHTIDTLVRNVLGGLVSQNGPKAVELQRLYASHLLANNPVTVNDAKFERTKVLTIHENGRYYLKLVQTVTAAPPVQPRAPEVTKQTTSTATNAPATPPPIPPLSRRDRRHQETQQPPQRERELQPAGHHEPEKRRQVDTDRPEQRRESHQRHRQGANGG